jgi:hypothetical protein
MKNGLHQNLTVTIGSEKRKVISSKIICPVCNEGSSDDPVVFGFEGVSIVRCSDCSTMHLFPMPDENSLSAIYNNNYYKDAEQLHGYFDYASEEGSIAKTYTRRIRIVQKKLKDKISTFKKYHEIGCALGIGLSAISRQLDLDVSGSDISKDAENACLKKGITFYLSDSKGRHPL